MRIFKLLGAAPLLLGLLSPSAAAAVPESTQLLQFRSASGESGQATLRGADRFSVAWRLSEASPDLGSVSDDGTFYYRGGGRLYAVLPSGARTPAAKPQEPDQNRPGAPSGFVLDGSTVAYGEAGGSGWTYTLAEGRRAVPATLQTDAQSNVYFQDDASNWYSLTSSGQERFMLELEQSGVASKCLAAPSGDSVCASPAFGLIGIREKTDAPRLFIGGRERFFPMRPTVIDGVTYVPLRPIADALNASVGWEGETRSITLTRGRAIRMTIDVPEATIDGKRIPLEHPPVLLNDATFVPLRFVGEALGEIIVWEEATRTIQIASP
ncbi:copper amine oxidase N-terminal domain-containing protein [Paenibacillus sp. GYB003]|uniref:copper amine oxidase N-terminal domain-containing protein n=1 Tax=Paenibacillus sp. GYB003 TaxID=2994392 RepID=UPI002F962E8E